MALKILLADDSMTAQNMGKKILSDAGYDVLTVSNGAAAVKRIPEIKPDIILLDVYMPGYNGLEVCERVKKSPDTAHVPVLLTVGKLEPFRPEEGMRAKADGMIIKPFEATDLIAVVGKLAERIAASGHHEHAISVPDAPQPLAPVPAEMELDEPDAVADFPVRPPQDAPAAPAFSDDILSDAISEPVTVQPQAVPVATPVTAPPETIAPVAIHLQPIAAVSAPAMLPAPAIAAAPALPSAPVSVSKLDFSEPDVSNSEVANSEVANSEASTSEVAPQEVLPPEPIAIPEFSIEWDSAPVTAAPEQPSEPTPVSTTEVAAISIPDVPTEGALGAEILPHELKAEILPHELKNEAHTDNLHPAELPVTGLPLTGLHVDEMQSPTVSLDGLTPTLETAISSEPVAAATAAPGIEIYLDPLPVPEPEIEFTSAPLAADVTADPVPELEPTICADVQEAPIAHEAALISDVQQAIEELPLRCPAVQEESQIAASVELDEACATEDDFAALLTALATQEQRQSNPRLDAAMEAFDLAGETPEPAPVQDGHSTKSEIAAECAPANSNVPTDSPTITDSAPIVPEPISPLSVPAPQSFAAAAAVGVSATAPATFEIGKITCDNASDQDVLAGSIESVLSEPQPAEPAPGERSDATECLTAPVEEVECAVVVPDDTAATHVATENKNVPEKHREVVADDVVRAEETNATHPSDVLDKLNHAVAERIVERIMERMKSQLVEEVVRLLRE